MTSDEIKAELSKLNNPTLSVEVEDAIWMRLRPHQPAILPYIIEAYAVTRPWKGRASLLYHSIGHVRISEEAVGLAKRALTDRSKVVRYYACALLAYSLKQECVLDLEKLLDHDVPETVEDARAAINAITENNHHLFMDRNGRGVRWNVATSF